MKQFLLRSYQRAQSADSLPTIHPLVSTATNSDQIESLFDSISYKKVINIRLYVILWLYVYSVSSMIVYLQNTFIILIIELLFIFDTIKGSCLVRMLRAYLGVTNFNNGIRHYLSIYKYKNADHNDLWRALQYVSKI